MKKIYGMLLAAVCVLAMTSCGDDNDNQATALSTINVLSSETQLQARPDTGKVVVDCHPVKAYVAAEDESWLKVEVKDDNVWFYATQNESTESRNSLLVIKKSDNDSVQLNILQKGMIFIIDKKTNITQVTDNAKSYYFNVNTDYVGNIVSTPEWAEARFENSRLYIDVKENNEGHLREGYVAYACGNYKDSIKVTQYDFDKDILGEYEIWEGYDADLDLCQTKIPATLQASANGSVTLNFDANYENTVVHVQLPVTFDGDSIAINIQSGQQVASFKDKRNKWTYFYSVYATDKGIVLPATDQAGNLLYLNTSGNIKAFMKYDQKKGTYGMFSGFAYNEGGYVGEFYKMYIGAFSTSSPYESSLINGEWWLSLSRIMLVKK